MTILVTPRWFYFWSQRFTMPVARRTYRAVPPRASAHRYCYRAGVPDRRASCSCGQLQAVVTSDPVRVSICHCLACQRRTGSSYGYQARFPAQRVTISGRSKQFIRHSDEDAEIRRFNFCPQCGATVFHTSGDSEDLIAIPVGAFADPAFPPPQVSVWEERKHGWVVVPDEAEHIH